MEFSLKISSTWSAAQLPNFPVKEDITTVTTSRESRSISNPFTFSFDCYRVSVCSSAYSPVQWLSFCKKWDKSGDAFAIRKAWSGICKSRSKTFALNKLNVSAHTQLLSRWYLINMSPQNIGTMPVSIPKLSSSSLAIARSPKSKQCVLFSGERPSH